MKSVCLIVIVAAMLPAWAEEPAKISVQSTGSVKVHPSSLEVQVTLHEKAASTKAVLDALQASKTKVLSAMSTIAPEKEVKEEMPFEVQKNQQQQMRMPRGRLAKPKKEGDKPEMELSQTIRIRIPLKGSDATALMVEADEIKTKVNAAKLLGDAKADEEETPDENYGNQQAPTSPVNYFYYAPSSPQDQESAFTEALKKAKESAAMAAKAMGKGSAELHSISFGGQNEAYNQYEYDPWGRPRYNPNRGEGQWSQTPEISVTASVVAEFYVK